MAFSTNFCPIKSALSGIAFWPQASDFQKSTKLITLETTRNCWLWSSESWIALTSRLGLRNVPKPTSKTEPFLSFCSKKNLKVFSSLSMDNLSFCNKVSHICIYQKQTILLVVFCASKYIKTNVLESFGLGRLKCWVITLN